MRMRALTLHRPWSWAIVAGHKPVENRPWAPPRNMIGVPFAIHSGKKWDAEGARFICDRVVAFPVDYYLAHASGAVIGVVTIERVVASREAQGHRWMPSDHPCHADTLTPDQRRWFSGPFGWVLRDVRRLEVAVPCRGYQMFWSLPAEVESEVLRQLNARAA